MAAAVPVRRVDAPKPRAQGVRRTPTPSTGSPVLSLVPKPRVAVNAAILLAAVVVVLMLFAVVLHTRIAERQLEIDRLEGLVTESRERFDVLRQQRAELRSPTRLAIEAGELGMVPAPNTEFLAIDPATMARVIAAAGIVDEDTAAVSTEDPLDQIRRVKAVNGD
jgi:hypothetical protein